MSKVFDINKMQGCLFVPVMNQLPTALRSKCKEYEWWRDDNIYFQYPVGLMAVSSLFSDPLKSIDRANEVYIEKSKFRENRGMPERGRGFLVGDSGGFLLFRKRCMIQDVQAVDNTFKAKFLAQLTKSALGMSYLEMLKKLTEDAVWADPAKILHWMEQNCDIGFTLDLPPFGSKARLGDLFKESADFTYNNNKIYARVREDPAFKIYSVLHGDTIPELDYWWDMMKEFNFEGYAVSCYSRADALSQAYILMYLYNKGVRKNVHLFGVGNTAVIVMLAYVSNWIEHLTFDSFSIGQGLSRRVFKMLGQRIGLRFGDVFQDENGGLEGLPCDCPVCSASTIEDYNDYYGGYRLVMHNLYDTIRWTHFCNSLRKVPEKLKSVAKQAVSSKDDLDVLRSIEFISCCMEEGFEIACNKYRLYLMSEDKLSKSVVSTTSAGFGFKCIEKKEEILSRKKVDSSTTRRSKVSKSNFMDSIVVEEMEIKSVERSPTCFPNFDSNCDEEFCDWFERCKIKFEGEKDGEKEVQKDC